MPDKLILYAQPTKTGFSLNIGGSISIWNYIVVHSKGQSLWRGIGIITDLIKSEYLVIYRTKTK